MDLSKVSKGALIGIDGSKTSNHGCRDYAVLQYIGNGKAKVIEAQSCTSCWQVGHDQDHIFAEVGETWDIVSRYKDIVPAEGGWSNNVKWELEW